MLLLWAAPLFAAPPSLEIPAEVKATGDYVVVQPKTDAVSVLYVALSGIEPFPSAILKDPRTFVLPVRGLAKGRYAFAAVGAGREGEQSRVDFVVLVGASSPPLPPDPPKPPETPVPGTGQLYAVIVQPNGPVQTNVEAVGKAILAQGKAILVRRQVGELQPDLAEEVMGKALPCFLVRQAKKAEDGSATVSVTVVPARPLPTADEAKALIEGVSK